MSKNDPGELDPQLAELLKTLQESGAPELYKMSPTEARLAYKKGVESLSGKGPEVRQTKDASVTGNAGPIDIRIYQPPVDEKHDLPLLVYFHGGGWSFGDLDTHDAVCRTFSARASCLVASVDYHLGPEHKFPTAVDDAMTAVSWAVAHAKEFGVDPRRLAVGGDSAGATLAAVASLASRDQGRPDIHCQLLIYPATDMSMAYPSHTSFGDGLRLTRPLMAWSAANYLRNGCDIMDPRASPIFANDHSNLPKAIIITAGFDPLHDEGKAYAEKLRAAGVDVQYRCFDNLIHGFINLTGAVNAAAKALDEITLMLKKQFA